jgi:hypothetical protein
LAALAWQQIFGSYSSLASRQWSLAPNKKICAASLPNSQLLNSFVYSIHAIQPPFMIFESRGFDAAKSSTLLLDSPLFARIRIIIRLS